MRLPNAHQAVVPESKVVGYLLSTTHHAGSSKARFFTRHGFTNRDWKRLARALRAHATENEVSAHESTAFGIRYVIDGPLEAPDGTNLNLRSVWFISEAGAAPRLVTAHPLGKATDDS